MLEDIIREQQLQQKSLAASQLTQALLSLWAAEKLCDTCAANKDTLSALIRDALVLYGSAFKYSDAANRNSPKRSYVPKRFEALHYELIAYRDSFFAHFGSKSPCGVSASDGDSMSWHGDAKGPLDFECEIPQMKALILEIVSHRLWPELLDEHQELLPEFDL